MKNIIKVTLLLLLAGGVASCNLDKYPMGSAIDEEQAFTTVDDAKHFRDGIYYLARQCFSAYTVVPVNIQGEGINATTDYGNIYGFQYTWTFLDSDAVVEQLWTYCYAAIYQINYFIEKGSAIRAGYDDIDETDTEAVNERNELDRYLGEAYLFRAMLYHQLATFYCDDYDPATATEEHNGLILSVKADVNARLERSSLFDTYDRINTDLAEGRRLLTAAGVTSQEYYLSPEIADYLEAKVLLHTDNWTEAAAKAAAIADQHPLITSSTDFMNMWKNNSGSEILFQFFASSQEGRSDYGAVFLNDPYQQGLVIVPYYIPTRYMVNQYSNTDIRKKAYVDQRTANIGTGTYSINAVTKYPGNPNLNSTDAVNDLMHNVLVYRSADFHLMAAEAYARINDLANANKYLKNVVTARDAEVEWEDYTSIDAVFSAIKNERLKEMFMEGNRIADLKRWGDGMDRRGQEPQNESIVIDNGMDLYVPADDYRFTWPIPQSEKNANPAIKDQTNW